MRTIAAVLLAVSALALLLAAPARAGTYPMYVCRLPDGSPAPVSASFYPYGSTVAFFNTCSSGGAMGAQTGGSIRLDSSGGIGVWVPPERPNLEITNVLTRLDSGGGPWSGSAFVVRQFAGSTLLDSATAPFARTTNLAPPVAGRNYDWNWYCTYSAGTNCSTGDGDHAMQLWQVNFSLRESADPSGAVSGGSLLGPGSVAGTASVNYTAYDDDSGVKAVQVRLGPTIVAADDLSAQCSFTGWNACPLTMQRGGVDVDTTRIPNGTYPLRLAVFDAAGNSRTLETGRSVTIDNGGASAQTPPTAGGGTSQPTAERDAARSADRGTHNGTGGGESATLVAELANHRQAMVVPYRRSAVTLSGRLTQRDGTPIAGARLDVTSESVHAPDPGPDGSQIVTDDSGRWHTTTAMGPSRKVTVAWRAFERDRSYAETTQLSLLVRAGVSLAARPHKVRNGGRVALKGRLLGEPFPPGGILVTLQGKPQRGGGWRTFGVTRTRPNGRFGYRYRFTRVRGGKTFTFRTRINRQDGYPYEAAVAGHARAAVRG